MSFESLDTDICGCIDQYRNDADTTIKSANIDYETAACLSRLVADNLSALNNIRMAVSKYMEEK